MVKHTRTRAGPLSSVESPWPKVKGQPDGPPRQAEADPASWETRAGWTFVNSKGEPVEICWADPPVESKFYFPAWLAERCPSDRLTHFIFDVDEVRVRLQSRLRHRVWGWKYKFYQELCQKLLIPLLRRMME